MHVTMSMMRKEFMTGTMDCDSAEMICGPATARVIPGHGITDNMLWVGMGQTDWQGWRGVAG